MFTSSAGKAGPGDQQQHGQSDRDLRCDLEHSRPSCFADEVDRPCGGDLTTCRTRRFTKGADSRSEGRTAHRGDCGQQRPDERKKEAEQGSQDGTECGTGDCLSRDAILLPEIVSTSRGVDRQFCTAGQQKQDCDRSPAESESTRCVGEEVGTQGGLCGDDPVSGKTVEKSRPRSDVRRKEDESRTVVLDPQSQNGEPLFVDHSAKPERLPPVPGGWTNREIPLCRGSLTLTLPSDPDLFLDDPEVIAANERDDYMPYWAFLWPASIPFANLLLEHPPWSVGTRVLDLGAGLGLAGLAALRRGDEVVFSDYDATALLACRDNAVRNGFAEPETCILDWRTPPDETFDVMIGCEITYEARLHETLLQMLRVMLAPDGYCWIADSGRIQGAAFYERCRDAGFSIRVFDRDYCETTEVSTTNFQLFEIRQQA
ncbi:Electron transfer flavoprotein beta subunit lysine methyltransferase (ETFB lysine methyltransferase) (ETFB-KMT) (Protein N-lysine methyltransferase METTL20) [Durusdinium trenchii]|uniref:Electron transfer flavoprotein beta subunit lysine methyltransferase (ETFB lysine methyltransferase) (ETFB-KMT) (Protein N-lysine methyltransferase METTL20) n=1 Tax=Durusdinium trenchii TaxID=1381693 RepID=A0ABP0R3F0_9DINO